MCVVFPLIFFYCFVLFVASFYASLSLAGRTRNKLKILWIFLSFGFFVLSCWAKKKQQQQTPTRLHTQAQSDSHTHAQFKLVGATTISDDYCYLNTAAFFSLLIAAKATRQLLCFNCIWGNNTLRTVHKKHLNQHSFAKQRQLQNQTLEGAATCGKETAEPKTKTAEKYVEAVIFDLFCFCFWTPILQSIFLHTTIF